MAFPFLTWQAFLSGQCVHHPLFRLAMMQCMATPSRFAARLPLHGKRCVSYDKATLTKEALLQKVEAGLGEDAHGNPLQIDVVTKTLSTAAGRLPISPILDPAWIKPRRRQRKERPTEPNGRFRKMLVRNPYAHALATPLRRCVNTNVTLPRYFLQDFELVKHPTTSATWWAPGPLSLDHIIKRSPPSLSITDPGAVESVVVKSPPTDAHQSVGASDAQTSESVEKTRPSSAKIADGLEALSTETPPSCERPHRAPMTMYTLCRKTVVDLMGTKKKYTAMMLGMRTGLAATPDTRESVWREDLGDVLLAMLRRRAVDALIERGRPTRHAKDQSIFNCASWDDVRHVERRGCVLWLPDHNMDLPQQYATLDIEDVQYGSKMVVHDLFWLLGDDQVRRLREESPMFRDGKILVLTHWGSITMMRLHLLLWRLQGYLDRQTAMKQHEARS